MITKRDRSSIWIAMSDLLLCIVSVVIVAVSPTHAKTDGIQTKAEYIITVAWDVNIDADIDSHLLGPSRRSVFYAHRIQNCSSLDVDNRGFIDSIITLDDGTKTKLDESKETIKIGCVEPGPYDLGVNLYGFRDQGTMVLPDRRGLNIKVHCEIIGLNPSVHIVYTKDIYLDHVGETINWASFNMARDGTIKLTDPPLAPITSMYQMLPATPTTHQDGQP